MARVGGQLQPPCLDQSAEGLGHIVNLMQHQLIGRIKAALHQNDGAAAALLLTLAHSVHTVVLGMDRSVKGHVGQIHILPAAVLALMMGHRRELVGREIAAVGNVILLHQRVILGHKADAEA